MDSELEWFNKQIRELSRLQSQVSSNPVFREDKYMIAKRKAFASALRKMSSFFDDLVDDCTREPYPTKWLRERSADTNDLWLN